MSDILTLKNLGEFPYIQGNFPNWGMVDPKNMGYKVIEVAELKFEVKIID